MFVQVTLKKGGFHGKGHVHRESEQISTVVKGKVRYVIGGKEYVATEGNIVFIPPNVEHTSEALEDSQYIDAFSPPVELVQIGPGGTTKKSIEKKPALT